MNDTDELDDLERELGPSLRVALGRAAAAVTAGGSETSPWASDRDPLPRPVEQGVTMVELEPSTRPATAPERHRRRFSVAIILSAAAAVAAVIAGVVALSRRDEAKTADQAVEAIGESFMAAWVRGDGDAVAALMSPDGAFDAWTVDTLPALDDWYRAVGWQYRDEGCEVMSGERLWCDYTVQNDLTRAFGRAPVTGSFVLVVDAGTVTSVRDDITIGAYRDIWTAFFDWVRANHPDDVDHMYTAGTSYARVDLLSIGLWERHSAEFVGSGNAYIARARVICTAAHDSYDGLASATAQGQAIDSEAAARILEEAVVELRVLPPPVIVEATFTDGYAQLDELVDWLRRSAEPTTVTVVDAPPSADDQDLTDLLNGIAHRQIGLERCAFNPST